MSDERTITVRCRLLLLKPTRPGDEWVALWDDSSPCAPGNVAVMVEVEVPIEPRVVTGKIVEREA